MDLFSDVFLLQTSTFFIPWKTSYEGTTVLTYWTLYYLFL